MEAKVIGIGGPSQAGKSTLASELGRKLAVPMVVIAQDDFVRPVKEIPMIRDRVDWETPDSIDQRKMHEAIEAALSIGTTVIVEGIFAFSFPWLNAIYDLSLKLQVDRTTFLHRRRLDRRWGEEPDWYLQYVWKAYATRDDPLPNPGMELDQGYQLEEVLQFIRHHEGLKGLLE